jgi:glycosyltransferase involved in cell wall biosynthesis
MSCKISICMIVKNEAELLPRALKNWKLLADEVIIVDTGSTDNTIEIAKSLGATVLNYDWQYPGNKGEARNVGIEAANGIWVIVLDADEEIQNGTALREALLSEQLLEHSAFNVTFKNFDENGNVVLVWQQIRIFKRGLYLYKHREHEMPYPIIQEVSEAGLDAIFEHRPPSNRAPTKTQPMLDRLLLDVEEHPNDPHPLYFLHRQFVIAEEWEKAIEFGNKYLEIADKIGLNKSECYGNMAIAFARLGANQMAINSLNLALAFEPERRIWWIRLAEAYHSLNKNEIALAFLKGACELPSVHENNLMPHTNNIYLYEFIDHCKSAMNGSHHHG